MIAKKSYYSDKDGNLVEEFDPKAAFLVAGKGTEIPKETMEKYGISEEGEVSGADGEIEGEADGEKASSPKANKSARPAENKSKKK